MKLSLLLNHCEGQLGQWGQTAFSAGFPNCRGPSWGLSGLLLPLQNFHALLPCPSLPPHPCSCSRTSFNPHPSPRPASIPSTRSAVFSLSLSTFTTPLSVARIQFSFYAPQSPLRINFGSPPRLPFVLEPNPSLSFSCHSQHGARGWAHNK